MQERISERMQESISENRQIQSISKRVSESVSKRVSKSILSKEKERGGESMMTNENKGVVNVLEAVALCWALVFVGFVIGYVLHP